MRKLAGYIMAGRPQAAIVVSIFAILALVFPPLILISGAALALVTMRSGPASGSWLLLISAAIVTAIGIVAAGNTYSGLAFGLTVWVPVMAMALALRYTVSLSKSLLLSTLLGIIVVLLVNMLVPHIDTHWYEMLNRFIRPLLQRSDVSAVTIDALFTQVAPVMTGRIVAWMTLMLALMLLIARWWQAILYNPGGFREEFRELSMGMPAAAISILLVAFTFINDSPLLIELATVSLVMFFLQGLAIVHSMVARTRNPTVMLVITYVLMIVIAPVKIGLMALGVIDSFVNIRQRISLPK